MKFQTSMPVRATLSAAALVFAMLSPAAAAEKDCPEGDLPVSGTIEGRATTAGLSMAKTSARGGRRLSPLARRSMPRN